MKNACYEGRHLNDDKSPLVDLFSCIACKETMYIELSAPDAEGYDIVQYRCRYCDGTERARIFRRGRREPCSRRKMT
jgi:hypothetical protein